MAFELYELLGVPFFTFHDRDIAPEGASLAESNRNVRAIAEVFAKKMETAKVQLLWGIPVKDARGSRRRVKGREGLIFADWLHPVALGSTRPGGGPRT